MTQQAVEANEMIHVGVADEGMTDFKQIAGRQGLEVPEVEDEGTLLKLKGNKKTGITVISLGWKLGRITAAYIF